MTARDRHAPNTEWWHGEASLVFKNVNRCWERLCDALPPGTYREGDRDLIVHCLVKPGGFRFPENHIDALRAEHDEALHGLAFRRATWTPPAAED